MSAAKRKLSPTVTATEDAEILSRELSFDGYHYLEVLTVRPKSLTGNGWAGEISREVFFTGKAALVLPYIPETDEVILNQQFRAGAFLAGAKNPFLFECAAGGIDDGETKEDAARREALEETGCEVTELEYIGMTYPSAGCLAEELHSFIGRISKGEAGMFGMAHEGEEIKTHRMTAAKALEMLDSGLITNAGTALILNWFARNKDRLRKKWLGQ